ncbi:MAG: hypothetical protein DWQ10_06035 [Calditrichaeota bacterium]|nr:MAG: hypothetical protein DWQ10_06035 [Calditrichota bacterium]
MSDAVNRLYNHIYTNHWNGASVTGPDPGIRFNSRIGRFVKSYSNFFPWADNLTYLQGQGYWIMANWLIADLMDDVKFRDIALACSNYIVEIQRQEGYWEYPNIEWKGRVATVEGCFATLGLLESYRKSGDKIYLNAAKKWFRFLNYEIGFLKDGEYLAANYFAKPGPAVPNISAMVLNAIGKLMHLTGDNQYTKKCDAMVAWLNHVQLETGELPYIVEKTQGIKGDRRHFLCYQYNAFEFLDLLEYYRFTKDKAILPVLEKLGHYLSTGITETGSANFSCHHVVPEVTYYTTVLATALSQAEEIGLEKYTYLAERAYNRVLHLQKYDGNFQFYSQKNYIFISDRRSYPRYLSMILFHLLLEYKKLVMKQTQDALVIQQ